MRLRLGSLASTAHSAQMPAQFYQHLSHRQHQPEPGTLPRAPQLHALPQHTRAVGPLLQPWPGPGPSSPCPGPVLCSPCPVTVTHLAFRRELQFSSMAGLTTAQLDHCLVGVRRTRAWSDRDTAWLTAGHLPRSPGFGPTTALVDHNDGTIWPQADQGMVGTLHSLVNSWPWGPAPQVLASNPPLATMLTRQITRQTPLAA